MACSSSTEQDLPCGAIQHAGHVQCHRGLVHIDPCRLASLPVQPVRLHHGSLASAVAPGVVDVGAKEGAQLVPGHSESRAALLTTQPRPRVAGADGRRDTAAIGTTVGHLPQGTPFTPERLA